MTARVTALDGFTQSIGWGDAKRVPLAGDASHRRYIRLVRNSESILIMDAPPEYENAGAFIKVANHLRENRLSAPDIIAADTDGGFIALEDFGDKSFSAILESQDKTSEKELYTLAIETIAAMHGNAALNGISLAPYDDDALMAEVDLLIDWYYPEVMGHQASDDVREKYNSAWREVFKKQPELPEVLVLRDFHIDNLMLLRERSGVARCGLLDFQDAVIGTPAYDITSLTEDARRDIDPLLREACIENYFALRPEIDRAAFGISYGILSAQRHAKIIGIFTRLHRRDGKPEYLKHIPRVLGYLRGHLENPVLAPVKDWFEREAHYLLEKPHLLS